MSIPYPTLQKCKEEAAASNPSARLIIAAIILLAKTDEYSTDNPESIYTILKLKAQGKLNGNASF